MDPVELDCGDNSCMFAENKTGARTNGGCRCLEKLGYSVSSIKAHREMARDIVRYRAALRLLEETVTDCPECGCEPWVNSAECTTCKLFSVLSP